MFNSVKCQGNRPAAVVIVGLLFEPGSASTGPLVLDPSGQKRLRPLKLRPFA